MSNAVYAYAAVASVAFMTGAFFMRWLERRNRRRELFRAWLAPKPVEEDPDDWFVNRRY